MFKVVEIKKSFVRKGIFRLPRMLMVVQNLDSKDPTEVCGGYLKKSEAKSYYVGQLLDTKDVPFPTF